jgi:hypothetical protein
VHAEWPVIRAVTPPPLANPDDRQARRKTRPRTYSPPFTGAASGSAKAHHPLRRSVLLHASFSAHGEGNFCRPEDAPNVLLPFGTIDA